MFLLGGLLGVIFIGMIALILSVFTTIIMEVVLDIHVMANQVNPHDPQIFPWILGFWVVAIICFFFWLEHSERKAHDKDVHGTTILEDV